MRKNLLVNRAHHVQITIPVGKESEARAFYCEMLGLPEVEKPDHLKSRGGFWLELANLQLHVGTEDGFDRLKTKAHIAYEVQDLGQIRSLLLQNGIEPIEGIPIPGYERFECRDPFGNRMEFIQRKS